MAECDVSKICRKCGESKYLGAFSRSKANKDGLENWCKSCKLQYHIINRDQILARKKARYAEKPKAQRKRPKPISEAARQARNAAARQRYAENREILKGRVAEWRKRNPERTVAQAARTRQKNKEKAKLQKAEYRAANPAKALSYKKKRRALLAAAPGRHTLEDVKSLLRLQRGMCAVCRSAMNGNYHVDHIHPISCGGSDDKLNLQLLCPTCNTSKHNKDPVNFMQSRGFLL